MSPFHPGPEALPEEVAVFPLTGALLLPQGRLPLNVFEPRYLALVLDSLAQGRMFGMIQPDAGPQTTAGEASARKVAAREKDAPPTLFRVGCLGRVSSFAETDDGRLLITLVGLVRFRVADELPGRRGYRRVRAEYGSWLGDLSDAGTAPLDRDGLLGALRPYFRTRRIEVNWEAIGQVPDSMLVTTLAMVCPFEPREKQALLEALTSEERARVLLALLQMEAMGGPDGSAGSGLPS